MLHFVFGVFLKIADLKSVFSCVDNVCAVCVVPGRYWNLKVEICRPGRKSFKQTKSSDKVLKFRL